MGWGGVEWAGWWVWDNDTLFAHAQGRIAHYVDIYEQYNTIFLYTSDEVMNRLSKQCLGQTFWHESDDQTGFRAYHR